MNRLTKLILFASVLAITLRTSAFACATCYGASDSPLAQGMNWGIMVLLGVVGCVLGGITTFFVYIGRNSAKLAAAEPKQIQTDKLP